MLVFRQDTKADIRIALLLSLAEVVQEVVQPVLAEPAAAVSPSPGCRGGLCPNRSLPAFCRDIGCRCAGVWRTIVTRWQKVCEHIGETIKTRAGSPIRCK